MFASTTVGFCRPLRGGELVMRHPDGLRVLQGPGVPGALSWPAKPSGRYALANMSESTADGVEVAAVAATVGATARR